MPIFGTEIVECHTGSQFEEGGLERFEEGTVAFYKIYHIFF